MVPDLTPFLNHKNLLAFSAGVDSTALFFLLIEAGVSFDIAHVNYHSRDTSDAEARYAQSLAQSYDKKLFLLDAALTASNTEANARKTRYDFFETVIAKGGYTMLLTAHQQNDQLEWFLMQLTKGAGVLELLGMQKMQPKHHYTHARPLLETPKATLYDYLHAKGHTYFEDVTNQDLTITRNYFRHTMTNELLARFGSGIQKSLDFLQEDKALLLQDSRVTTLDGLTIIEATTERALLFHIDKALKAQGYMLSQAQRTQIATQKSVTVGGRFHVELQVNKAYIVPVIEAIPMPKSFKELCRTKKVPLKLRSFLFVRHIDITQVF